MRFLYTILPLLSAVALAQDLVPGKCECPQVKCKTDDPVKLCQCINDRETKCKKKCPDYEPQFKPCPRPEPEEPPKCPCPEVACLMVWPGSCYCANAAKQKCYDDCGGPKPELQQCPPMDDGAPTTMKIEARAPEPEVVARAPEVAAAVAPFTPEKIEETPCECEQVFCILSFPEGCYCQNNAARACEEKCGVKAQIRDCSFPGGFTTSVKPQIKDNKPPKTKDPKPSKTKKPPKYPTNPTPSPQPNPHKPCGGFRIEPLNCDAGEVCIRDPFVPGCGPACDQTGICVQDKICGGFAGFACPDGQVCVDDERDTCDPMNGGADCAGLCVTPHAGGEGSGLPGPPGA